MSWRLDRRNQPSIPIVTNDTTIGSSNQSDVRLPGLNPQHALLRVVAGRLFLASVDDAPLWVNGNPVGQSFLNTGDKIQFSQGGDEFILAKGDVPAIAPATSPQVNPFSEMSRPSDLSSIEIREPSRPLLPRVWIAAAMIMLLVSSLGTYFLFSQRSEPHKSVASVEIETNLPSNPKPPEAEPEVKPESVKPNVVVANPPPKPPNPPEKPADEMLVKPDTIRPAESPDPFPAGSVWKNDVLRMSLKVTQRKGETFQGKFVIGDSVVREIKGTFKDGTVRWSARQVRAIKGDPGGDHIGQFGQGDYSDQLNFEWTSSVGFGNFTLQRE